MKKQKIVVFLLLMCFLALPLINLQSAAATVTYYSSNDAPTTASYAPNGVNKGWGHTFTSLETGTADTVTMWLDRDGTPTGEMTVEIWTANATNLIAKVGNGGTLNIGAVETKTIYYIPVSASLTEGQMYAVLTNVTVWSGNWGIRGWGVTGGGDYYWVNSGSGFGLSSNYEMAFSVLGSDATPTPSPSPTPTASPTPFTYQGDIWAALSPYANILLPLVLIIFIALLCGKYGGVWGFFAGLNVTAILVYAIMGTAYMPLWGLVMLALVDGLLLFGKISGRM